MRRWMVAVSAVAALAVLSACGDKLPAGVDGDLDNGWKAFPAATQWRPDSDTCHAGREDFVTEGQYSDMPCQSAHGTETIAVADLPASITDEDDGPAAAFKACIPKVNAFVGGDYRTGWVFIQPVLPGDDAWAGGARWYRCDIGEVSKADRSMVVRSGSMKNSVKAGGQLFQGCFHADVAGTVANMHALNCSQSHDTEFAGLYNGPTKLSQSVLEKGCYGVIAGFAKVPNDGNMKYRTGWLSIPPDDANWDLGDHAIRCYIWQDKDKITGSYKGAGPNKLHIHYA